MPLCIVKDGFRPDGPIVLNDAIYATMPDEEADFWRLFFREVTASVGSVEDNLRDEGLIPTPSLIARYHRAITEFDGRRYAQILRLESMFTFPPVPVQPAA
jgi:hypothetical protein